MVDFCWLPAEFLVSDKEVDKIGNFDWNVDNSVKLYEGFILSGMN